MNTDYFKDISKLQNNIFINILFNWTIMIKDDIENHLLSKFSV